ncbi:MAG: BON domain-containing protein [Deltaproteobacteria bacterium]|nr:BON domain-containing protein [Deltaproteobacteria bacterium]TLN00373.1 MAG: BON domain-containing protein [bacterium]
MRVNAHTSIFTAILAAIIFSAVSAFAGIPTQVAVNKSILLNLNKPATRISVANPAIAEFLLLSPRQIQLNGIALGTTNLIVWEKGEAKPIFFDVKVGGDASSIEAMIHEMAPNDNINVEFANDTVVLTGKATNEQTIKKAVEIAAAYSPGSSVSTTITEKDGIKTAKTDTTAKVINHIIIDQPNQVLLQVKVAQVDKSSLKKLGVSFMIKGQTAEGFSNLIGVPTGGSTKSQSSSGDGFSSSEVGSGTGISGNVVGLGSFNPLDAFQFGVSYFPAGIGAVMQALTTKGLAKILAEPNLLVKTGERGEFRAVSRIPYSVLQTTGGSSTSTIVFEEVGIKLFFNPEVLDNGMIRLKIDPAEVSSIAGTLAVNGYPIIDTRSAKTNVELKNGESLIIAGLLSEEAINTMSKIPLLGDIPILGALFRSTQKDIKEKELVFFITPKLMRPTESGVKTELPTDKHPTPAEEKELRWIPIP